MYRIREIRILEPRLTIIIALHMLTLFSSLICLSVQSFIHFNNIRNGEPTKKRAKMLTVMLPLTTHFFPALLTMLLPTQSTY